MEHTTNKVEFIYNSLDEAFPPCDPQMEPLGSRVLVQVRSPKKITKGGIILTQDAKETELANTQVAKVLAIGPIAFKSRNTMEPWPEGAWAAPGEFVRIPRYAGDRWHMPIGQNDEEALLAIFNDLDLVAKVTGDPLAIKAFL